jgi:hypothetical protein
MAAVERASMVVVLAAFVVARQVPDTLEAESAAGGVESASVDRTSRVGFRTLPVQDPGSLHLEDPHSNNLPLKEAVIDP